MDCCTFSVLAQTSVIVLGVVDAPYVSGRIYAGAHLLKNQRNVFARRGDKR